MEFKEIVEKYKSIIAYDPIMATQIGIHDRDLEVSDLTVKAFEKELTDAKELLEIVKSFDDSVLSFEDKIDLKLMVYALERTILFLEFEYNGLKDYEQKPNLGNTVINAFLYLFLKDPRDSKTRLDIINSRFSKIPFMIEDYKQVLKKAVTRWKGMELEEIEGMEELFSSIILWAENEKYDNIGLLKENIEKVNLALNDYVTFLNGLEEVSNFVVGKEVAQNIAKLNGIDFTLDEIYEIAKRFFSEHNLKIDSLVESVKSKYSLDESWGYEEVLSFLKEKYGVPISEVVNLYAKEQERVSKYLNENDLFVFPKSDRLQVLKTPAYLVPTIPVGAMFPPAAFENGVKVSLVYVTIDEGRSKDQNSLMIINTMIHEGIPGHHLQLAMAGENESIVRKLAEYNTHAEGWTTYLEQFMSEIGFISDDIKEEYELIALADFSRLGARVAIDLFFMTGDESYLNVISGFEVKGDSMFGKAKSLLQRATGFTDARCEGELNWYSKQRGYPMCYLLGNIMTNNLKNEIIKSNPNLNFREASKLFHKYYLEEGVMPHSFLREILVHKGLIK